MSVAIGERAPDFRLRNQHRQEVDLDDLAGRNALIVFIPYPFTRVCDGELCSLRDDAEVFESLDARVVVITCHAMSTNRRWAEEYGYDFDILADYWPHGEVAKAFGAFDEQWGHSNRYTFVIDAEGIVREIIKSDELGTPREVDRYREALAALSS